MCVHHKNLTPLVGYCDEGSQKGIIYEHMANGNLGMHLFGRSPNVLSWKKRLEIGYDVAQGRAAISEDMYIVNWVKSMLAAGNVENIIDPRLHGDFNINTAWKVVELAITCVDIISSKRPTMNDVVTDLKICLKAKKEGDTDSLFNGYTIDSSSDEEDDSEGSDMDSNEGN
nr:leucine-rich repeat transmembrane protein kinase protein [Tanacetum cinerariifolium]